MRQRLTRISKLLNQAERLMGKSAMREALQWYYNDGIIPESEPAQSFALLMQAFDRMIDASVGGGNYDAARVAYEGACRRWKRAERGLE